MGLNSLPRGRVEDPRMVADFKRTTVVFFFAGVLLLIHSCNQMIVAVAHR